jgi:predicted phosphodiesterase
MLQNINIEILQKLIEEAPLSSELAQDIKSELQDIAIVFMLHLFLLAAVGGMLGAILVSGRRMKTAIYGAIAGILLCLLLVLTTQTSYQTEKLRTPEYHGALKAAPWAIDMAEKAFQKFNLLGEQMQIIATNLYKIFEQIDKATPIKQENDDLLVLHVSDSPQTIKDLSAYPQVQVLTGGIVDVQGLRIMTIADPASTSNAITLTDQLVISEMRARIMTYWQEALNKPNLIAVHNYILAEELVGVVPLILFGHTHQYTIREEKGTVLINAGTTGAAGLRGLQATKEIPYSVVLMHFKRDENNDLILSATDTIKVYNLETGFILERKLFSS